MAIITKANGTVTRGRVLESGEGVLELLFDINGVVTSKRIDMEHIQFPITIPLAGEGDSTANNPNFYGFRFPGSSHGVTSAPRQATAGLSVFAFYGGYIEPADLLAPTALDQTFLITGGIGDVIVDGIRCNVEALVAINNEIGQVCFQASSLELLPGTILFVRQKDTDTQDTIYGNGVLVEGESTTARTEVVTAAQNQRRFELTRRIDSVTSISGDLAGVAVMINLADLTTSSNILTIAQDFDAGTEITVNYESTLLVKGGQGQALLRTRTGGQNVEVLTNLNSKQYPFPLESNETIQLLGSSCLIA